MCHLPYDETNHDPTPNPVSSLFRREDDRLREDIVERANKATTDDVTNEESHENNL